MFKETSVTKKIQAFAKIAEKKFGSIWDEPLSDPIGYNGDLYFKFNISDDIIAAVQAYKTGSIDLFINNEKDNETIGYRNLSEDSFMSIINEPLVEFLQIERYEYFFKYKGNSFLLQPSGEGYMDRGIAINLFLLDGLKKTHLRKLGWVKPDNEGGEKYSGALDTNEIIDMSVAKGMAIGYINLISHLTS